MMKNKILLGSVTLLTALIVAACGNGEKKALETTAAPTTEVTTATPTTTAPTTTASASSDAKEVSLGDTQRIGREDVGYINVPKEYTVAQNILIYSVILHQINTIFYYSKVLVKSNLNLTMGNPGEQKQLRTVCMLNGKMTNNRLV